MIIHYHGTRTIIYTKKAICSIEFLPSDFLGELQVILKNDYTRYKQASCALQPHIIIA